VLFYVVWGVDFIFAVPLLLYGSCGENNKRYMPPHPHPDRFNIRHYGAWKKTRTPPLPPRQQQLRHTKPQKGMCFFCILVVCRKTPHPHKETKQKFDLLKKKKAAAFEEATVFGLG
jgi:hypothetical protein